MLNLHNTSAICRVQVKLWGQHVQFPCRQQLYHLAMKLSFTTGVVMLQAASTISSLLMLALAVLLNNNNNNNYNNDVAIATKYFT